MKKVLITRPYSSQVTPLLNAIKNDPFFKEGSNYEIYDNSPYLEKTNKMTFRKLSKYKVIVCDVNPIFITGKKYIKTFKNKKQIMIQLTHGVWTKKPNSYLYANKKTIDFILSPNKYSNDLYNKMGYSNDQILDYGFLRNQFYSEYNTNDIKEKLFGRIPQIRHYNEIVLFAPSWIGNNGNKKVTTSYSLNSILSKISDDSFLIVAPHSLTERNNVNINYTFDEKYTDKVFIWKHYDRLNGEKLMLISDKLFTDYSSIIFDFAALKGIENSFHYFPLDDPEQSSLLKSLYEKQYSQWGENLQSKDRENIWKDMKYFNSDNVTKPALLLKEHIKKLLK